MSESRCEAALDQPTLWTIVLAGGAGRRLSGVTNGVPKQFWRPHGGPSLLDTTLDRLASCAPPCRTAVVVDRSHINYVRTSARRWRGETVLYQPGDRGTAAGVLFGLMPVFNQADDAIIVLTPADHAVADAAAFRRGIEQAVAAVRSRSIGVVLFGVTPEAETTDYGWIMPGTSCPPLDGRFRVVAGFAEKPSQEDARDLFLRGALWNTMVLVARVDALLALYRRHLPALTEVLTRRHLTLDDGIGLSLDESYARLRPSDFSRDLLAAARGLAVYQWSNSIGWSDLGTPARLHAWLRRPMSREVGVAS